MKNETLCECVNWAREINLEYLANHHPKCGRYNESLIDVWKVSVGNQHCILDNEEDAKDLAGEDCGAVITTEKMHREVLEHLPEFDGF